jgi:hypothetical protein
MTRFNKALLASASLVALTTAANAQVLPPVEYVPGGAIQSIPSIGTLDLVNIVGAVGENKGYATSVKTQIASITLNQFGASGGEVAVAGPYFVQQSVAFGGGAHIDALNSNSSFTPGGFSTTGGSQIIVTAINNIGVDFKPDSSVSWTGDPKLFEAIQTFAGATGTPDLQITQQNSMTAGYDTNNPGASVGTGGAAIVGKATDGSTTTIGLQVNSVAINAASIGVPDRTNVDVKVVQSADLSNTNIDLFNVADAGAQTGTTPTPPGKVIDPEIQNLQQVASFSANTANFGVTGSDPKAPGYVPGTVSVNLVPGFDKSTNPWGQITNQSFLAGDGTGPQAEINLYNVAQALTWAPKSYTGPGSDWTQPGEGNVQIGTKDFKADVSGPVKQIAAFTVNTVSGPTSQNPLEKTDAAVVFAGSINDNTDPFNKAPLGITSFKQTADLSRLDLDGRANPSVGGAGVLDLGLVLAAEAAVSDGFPGLGGTGGLLGLPVSPTAPTFWWTGTTPFGGANNTAIAGTGTGNSKIEALDQITAVTANSFSFDNTVRNDKQEVTIANTDVVGGLIDQSATLPGSSFASTNTQLANLAVAASTVKGTATLDTVSQTNAFTVNSFTAGTADFKTGVIDPTSGGTQYLEGGLKQSANTNGGVLNLGNVAVAYGSNAIAKDVKQINAVSLNTASINNVSGGSITQSLTGPLNVNSGNYLSAVANVTGPLAGSASITGGTQVGVISVNSISGSPVTAK